MALYCNISKVGHAFVPFTVVGVDGAGRSRVTVCPLMVVVMDVA